jgi:hypothetical protein
VVHDLGDSDAFGAELGAFLRQRVGRARLEGKMIEGGGNAQAAVYARVIVRRIRDVPAQKGEAALPDIEEEVPGDAASVTVLRSTATGLKPRTSS